VSASGAATTALAAVARADVHAALRRAGATNALLGMDTDDGGAPAALLCGTPGRSPGRTARDAAAYLVHAVGAWLNTAERRVAASMVVLGYAARLVGPSVAVLLRDGLLLDLRPERVRYTYVPDRGFRLSSPEPAGWRGPAAVLRERWGRDVVDSHLDRVVAGVRAVVPVAAALLWGNVASGLAGALRSLARTGAVPLDRCHGAGLSMLDHGPLRGAGRLWVDGGELRFLRRSCCLFYRLDGGGTCADCPLSTRAQTP